MTRGKFAAIAIVCAASASVLGVPAGTAGAAAPSWSAATKLPDDSATSGVIAEPDPLGGAMYFYNVDGVPTLSRVDTDGSLYPPLSVPQVAGESTDDGIPEQLVMRPDGSALIAWKVQGAGDAYLSYVSEDGVFGAPALIDTGFEYFVNDGTKIVILSADGSELYATAYKLSKSGHLSAVISPLDIYTGSVNRAWMALDASGRGDVVVYGTPSGQAHDQVSEIPYFDAVYQPPTTISTAGDTVNDASFATTSNGRSALGWVETSSNGQFTYAVAGLRDPGENLIVGGLTNTNSSFGTTGEILAASGTDGTLAIAPMLYTYTAPGVYGIDTSVFLVAPGGTTVGSGVDVEIPLGNHNKFSALGAGHGQAIVGYSAVVKSGPFAGFPSSYSETQAPGATVVYPNGTTASKHFAEESGVYDPAPGDNCPPTTCTAAAPTPASILAVTDDAKKGMTTAVGQILPKSSGDPLAFVTRRTYTVKPKLTLASKELSATKKNVSVPLSCAKKDCAGKIALASVIKVKHKGKVVHKTISLGKTPYSLLTGASATKKVALTDAGKAALKAATDHSVHATLVITTAGGKTLTKKVTVAQ